MPCISRFYGITIRMFFSDHVPPHFHARYSGREAKFLIENGERIGGALPTRAEKLVRTWAHRYKSALLTSWNMGRETGRFMKVPPLE